MEAILPVAEANSATRAHSLSTIVWLIVLVTALSGSPAKAEPSPVQPPDGAIAWWSFDESSGTIAADRLGNFPGAYTNGPAPATGEVRGALRFNGASYLSVQDSDVWAFGNRDFSIELWANFDQVPGGSIGEPSDIFVGNDEGPSNRNKWFFAVGGGYLNFHINGPGIGPKFFPLVPFAPVVGQWYHLAVVRSGTEYTIYINGAPSGTAENADDIPNANAPLTIGQAEQIGFTHSRLDELTIYSRALSDEEIKSIYDAGVAGKTVNLSIFPSKGGDTGNVTAHVNGTGFAPGATIKLSKAGQPDIVGGPVTIEPDGTAMDATFALAGKTQGIWNVVVTNPGGTTYTLPGGFIIEKGRADDLSVEIEGLPVIRVGRAQLYWVLVRNRGNVDANNVSVVSAVWPEESREGGGFVATQAVTSGLDPTFFSQTDVGLLPAGQTVPVPIVPKMPAAGCYTVTTSPQINPTPNPNDPDHCKFLEEQLARLESELQQIEEKIARKEEERQRILEQLKGPLTEGERSELLVRLEAIEIELNNLKIKKKTLEYQIRKLEEALAECLRNSGRARLAAAPLLAPLQSSSFDGAGMQVCTINSFDPNDKIGPQGNGELGYVSERAPIPYSIFFENVETATAPAQEALVADQLDPAKVDLSTFSLGPVSFGENLVIPPPGRTSYTAEVDLRPGTNLIARIVASLDPNTGLATWRFTSIDPTTGNLPADPRIGFLPPDITPPQGAGSVLFTVSPKQGLPTGTQISNNATIVFDVNPPITTQEWVNTIDNTKPTSSVLALAVTQTSASFPVTWSGSDVGAGIRDFSIFVSDNSGPYTPFLQNANGNSGTFAGTAGHTYAFYSVARDLAGNVQDTPAVAQAVTKVGSNRAPTIRSAKSTSLEATSTSGAAVTIVADVSDTDGDALTVKWTVDGKEVQVDNVAGGKRGTSANVSMTHTYGLGWHTVNVTVSDGKAAPVPRTTTVKVVDTTAPVISHVSASPASIGPPTKNLVKVAINYNATDAVGPVTSSLSVNGKEKDKNDVSSSDFVIVDAHTVKLRAQKGAVYKIKIASRDPSGNTATKTVTVNSSLVPLPLP